jgi:hypothetical protein
VADGKSGDRLVVESERVGNPAREGEILAVMTATFGVHYRVRWDDGHESSFFPSGGSMQIVQAKRRGVSKT